METKRDELFYTAMELIKSMTDDQLWKAVDALGKIIAIDSKE
jgi:hypothetical protein